IPITSVSASGYGATDPDFTWLDMEALLLAEGVFSTRSVAASPGGENDMGRGLPPRGREKIWEAIERNGVRAIRTGSLEESIAQRMGIYHDQSGGQRIKTYINVGGGIASLGSAENKPFLNSGLLMDLPLMNFPRKGTMMRMADSGIPVVHLSRVQSIAREHGLAIEPVEMPEVGLGDVFLKIAYRVDLAVVLLIVYLGICCLALLPEVRRRVAPGERNRKR
ncbi:MAG: poly-gamma-glutamate system protein, partial [Candidatus Eisenbacteria sp.]|nr:poly-gamma-glutamate system protein [Candidatus Eisenbacteria bacterium]